MRLCSTIDCIRVACSFPLSFDGVLLPPMCCGHMDGFMADLGGHVPADEGAEGFDLFRATHKEFHEAVTA